MDPQLDSLDLPSTTDLGAGHHSVLALLLVSLQLLSLQCYTTATPGVGAGQGELELADHLLLLDVPACGSLKSTAAAGADLGQGKIFIAEATELGKKDFKFRPGTRLSTEWMFLQT